MYNCSLFIIHYPLFIVIRLNASTTLLLILIVLYDTSLP